MIRYLEDIVATKKGDKIWLGMFFVAKRDIVNALIDAANRGVEVNMILDPNENSFGQQKSGLPNRPVVQEMVEDTKGKLNVRCIIPLSVNIIQKQFGFKRMSIRFISNGSANYTERTLDDYNLENNLKVIAPNDSKLVIEMEANLNDFGIMKMLCTQ